MPYPPLMKKKIWFNTTFKQAEIEAVLSGKENTHERVLRPEGASVLIFKNLSEIQGIDNTSFPKGVTLIYTENDTKIGPTLVPFDLLSNFID